MYQLTSSVMVLLVVVNTIMARNSNKCPEGSVLEWDPFQSMTRCVEECPAGTVMKWSSYGGSHKKCIEECPDGKVLALNRWNEYVCAELIEKREALDAKMAHNTKRDERGSGSKECTVFCKIAI